MTRDLLSKMEDRVPKDVRKKALRLMVELDYGAEQFLEPDVWIEEDPLAAVNVIHKWMKGLVQLATQFPPGPWANKTLKQLQKLRNSTELLVSQTKQALDAGEGEDQVHASILYGIRGDSFPHPDYKNY